jgi:hypothetical protein
MMALPRDHGVHESVVRVAHRIGSRQRATKALSDALIEVCGDAPCPRFDPLLRGR